MADDDIEININTTGVEKASSDLNKVANSGKKMGDSLGRNTAIGMAGGRGLEVVVSDLSREFGISGEAASVMGRSVGLAAESIGKATILLGAVGIAAYGAYMVYEQFTESSSKLREETLRDADAAMKWVEAARINTKATKEMTAAKEELWGVEKDKNIDKLKKGVVALSQSIDEQRDKVKKLQDSFNETFSMPTTPISAAIQSGISDKLDSAKLKLRDLIGQFHEKEAALKGGPLSNRKQDEYNAQLEIMKASDALWGTEDKNYAAHLDMQLAIFDATADAEIQKLRDSRATRKRIRDEEAVDTIKRDTIIAAEKDRIRQDQLAKDKQAEAEKRQMQMMTISYTSSILGDLAALGIAHGKQGAEAAKKEARMRAIVNTAAGITKAFAEKGWAGAYEAALIAAAGLVQIAKINSASYGSDSGSLSIGGASAVGTGGTDSGYKYFDYESSVYGSGWRPGMGQTGNGGDTYIYAMDSKSFEKFMMENAGTVKKANDHANKGYA